MHELFHIYQFKHWQHSPAENNTYILSEELILSALMLHDLMVEACQVKDRKTMKQFLTYYAGIRYEMLQLGEATVGYVNDALINGDRIEGTARYVETFSAETTFFPDINDDPTHSWGKHLTDPVNPQDTEYALFNRSRYHIGAIITHFLKKLNVDAAYRANKSPYDLIVSRLQMDERPGQRRYGRARCNGLCTLPGTGCRDHSFLRLSFNSYTPYTS